MTCRQPCFSRAAHHRGMNKVLPLLLSLSAAASAASVTLQPGQTGRLAGQKVTVLRVNDSRCQPGTQCIRAGEIQARVLVAEKGRFRLLTLQFPEARNTPWAGLRLSAATFDRLPKLTFTDGRE
ncbi:hypothetical protein E5E91_09910 [Deinococcus radiodurans R1 = ATCC 13939 = DSM 20539]|uniref:Uncharacterized protein n=2 Tax=Deinococcus radiodurans TaxID=1299 RepID=Q9RT46_DEIRA|nr:hypothetical protein DR_1920 [Deinococcus radiodurans R1 = ATCC 13939 = DSM 20539]ANC70995.1 hypothetical protein A2G07_04010 [Deinococcus radiodurans R1 = ATCC 13939 = DSM 20539]QEM71328.1 hypothetical protein DXG80_05825 [Deinococcus radiodurans]UDL00979.1 hypothetical protein E5E91_09910 [Deinococcus radiodurans R1 = ATCC 13939 = DSM 20539]HCE65041.1 hypothetical protein [Deinococcus radiodurans]